MELEQPINAYVCQYCKGSFDKLENLSKHVQKIHTACTSGKENRICPLCGTQCIKSEGYRNHLRHIHGHNEEGQVVLFKSFNDFLVWKNELEKRNYCKYVMREPPKKLPSKDKIHIYRCDSSVGSMKEKRSGVAVKESCPAVITAIESAKTKGVKIEHWNNHVGHIIPVEEAELDAAIGSLGTTEIVLSSDQRYQYEGQSADGNIFFVTESNDGSLSETLVRQSPKKSSNLFQNKKAKLSENFPKPSSQKFSYKKDPTKKSGSFNYSLASVACMKPSTKKKILSQPDAISQTSTTSNATDTASITVSTSNLGLSTPASTVASSEVELAAESIMDLINSDSLSKTDSLIKSNKKETPTTIAPPSKSISMTNTSTITNQTFEFINEGSLSGQVVLLNSSPGQNGKQNVYLSADQKFITIGPPISVEKITPKKGKTSKKSQKRKATSQIIVIPTASEKENVSSVQNVLNLNQNPIPVDSIVRSPGPSILKRAKKSVQKSPRKIAAATEKTVTVSAIDALSQRKRYFTATKKVCLGLNPTLDITVMDGVESTQGAPDKLAENVGIDSAPLEVNNSTPNTSINFESSIQDTVTASSPIIASSSVSSPVQSTVLSSVESTVSPSVESTVSPSVGSTVSPSVLSTVLPSVQSTVSSSIQSTVSSSDQNYVSSITLNPVSSAIQNPVSSAVQNPVSSAIQNPVSSAIQSSVSTTIQRSVSSAIQNSVSSAIQNPVSSTVKNSISTANLSSVSSPMQRSVSSSISNMQPINPIILNSFPPGQTFMSINNNLIPIGTPTAPLLPGNFNPGFVLTSPVPPSPVTRPFRPAMTCSRPRMTYSRPRMANSRPRMTYSRPRMANSRPRMTYSRVGRPPGSQTVRPTTPVGVSDKKTQLKQTSIGTATPQKTPPHTSTVPFLLIPNSASQIRSSVPFSSQFIANNVNSTLPSSIRPNKSQPQISNSLISVGGCSGLPRPLLSSNTPVYTQLPPGAQLISSAMIPNLPAQFLCNNGQRISRPVLQNIPLLTANGQQVSRSILQNISFTAPVIGQPLVAPIAPRPIVSTTISNTIKVQKVQLPLSKTSTSLSVPLPGIAGVTTTLSEATKVSSVVLNTEPISSAPAISIPPLASIGSHKPGSVIFESQGDMYMLEPVEENSQINNNTTVKNAHNKMSIAIPSTNGNTKFKKSDDLGELALERNKANLSSLQKDKATGGQSTLDTRVDGKVKSLSPRKNTDIKNGVQIKSVVQEKRHLKDDDVEILKKVKYYQMEMKYLASQAECQRLKLELARAQMKNKEVVKNNTDLLPGEISIKGNTDGAVLDIDGTSKKNKLGLKQSSCVENVIENMDVDFASHEGGDKTEEQSINKVESTIQSETDSCDSNHGDGILAESEDSNYMDNCPADSEDSNQSNNIPPDSGDSNNVENCPEDSGDSNNVDNCPVDSGDSNNMDNCSGDSNNVDNCPADSGDSNNVDNCPADSGDSNNVDNCSEDSNHSSNIPPDSGDSNYVDNCLADSNNSNNIPPNSGVSNHSDTFDLSSKQDETEDSLEKQNSNHDMGDGSCDIVSNEVSNSETPTKETSIALNKEFQTVNTQENHSTPSTETSKTERIENPKDSDKSFENQVDESMDISELMESLKESIEDTQTTNNSEIVDVFVLQESVDKQVPMLNQEKSVENNYFDDETHRVDNSEFCQQKNVNQEESMDLDEHNDSSFETGKMDLPCDKSQFQETLKELEFQYGAEGSSDIYTMIRTSVLRSLYDDMKTLCEENKKLYERLQNSRSCEESCEDEELCN